jgi:hypothetical protein
MDAMPKAPAKPGASHWLDEPRNVKRLWRAFLAVLALSMLAELLLPLHPQFDIESVLGFSAWFGFIACTAMIVVAKALALVLKRPDTYYGKRDE